jgi:twitching motility protein PilT
MEKDIMDIAELVKIALNAGASDLHLSAELPPLLRIDGEIQATALPPLAHSQIHSLVYALMNNEQIKLYEKYFELDFICELTRLSRFRVHVFRQNRGTTAVFRGYTLSSSQHRKIGIGKYIPEISMQTTWPSVNYWGLWLRKIHHHGGDDQSN